MKNLLTFLAIAFCFTGNAQYTTIVNFNNTNGDSPTGGLYFDGTFLYGMTSSGGTSGYGVIFKVKPDGTGYTKLLNFDATTGQTPNGTLISDGTFLYGITSSSIFKIMPNGTGFVKLLDFTGPNGSTGVGSLLWDGNFLFGMTRNGGASTSCGSGCGTIFKIKTDGTGYIELLDFANDTIHGYNPDGSLITDGTYLYGMTMYGGLYDYGTVFKIMLDGSGYEKLLEFSGVDGHLPSGSLFLAGGDLYGMTQTGGSATACGLGGCGTIFKIKSDGTNFTKLKDFDYSSSGAFPTNSSFISDGTFLYSVASNGGVGYGVIFKIKLDGSSYSDLWELSPSTFTPTGFIISSGGYFYGTTQHGGTNSNGAVFKFSTLKIDSISSTNTNCYNANNGIATINVTGGLGPYTYLWSDGQTTDIASNLIAGDYTITVTDANNEQATATVNITQPSLSITITPTQTDVSCYGDNDGSATLVVSGCGAPFTYLWSNSQTTSTINNLIQGVYTCTVTDTYGSIATPVITINQPNLLTVGITPSNAFCDNSGIANTVVTGGTPSYSYLWSNAQTSVNAMGLVAGNYTLTTTDSHSCIATQTVSIINTPMPAPLICMLSTDSLSINNYIYWNKTLYTNVDSFILYRYDIFSGYLKIGSVSKDSLSQFIDTSRSIGGPNGGDPQYGSWKYKMAILDTCGNISAQSPYHESIFIQENFQNFTWNSYNIEAGQTNPVTGYKFSRDDNNTGSWHVLINTGGTAATDPSYASFPNGNWRVDALTFNCTPTMLLGNNNTQGAVVKSRSNVRNNRATNISKLTSSEMKIYPNPSSNEVTITLSKNCGNCKIEIVNTLGETLKSISATSIENKIDISEFANGVYFVKVTGNSNSTLQKLVVQH